jgi:tetratricopeptide (TPR) repeat protein
LAMLHDFGQGEDTAAVIKKELKIEPEAFDKQFIAFIENDTRKQVENFDKWRAGLREVNDLWKKKDYDAVIEKGTAIRDLYPDYVEAGSVYEFLANAYREKKNKSAEIAELQRYVKNGGRSPSTIKSLAKSLEETGNKKEAAAVLERLNYIYPMDNEQHQMLGTLWLEEGNTAGAAREFGAVVAHQPVDPAQAHFDLARALAANRQTDKAKEEVFAALEAAPGFRPAQKLLLQLNQTESK